MTKDERDRLLADLTAIRKDVDGGSFYTGLGRETEMFVRWADRFVEELDPLKFSDDQRGDVVKLVRLALMLGREDLLEATGG